MKKILFSAIISLSIISCKNNQKSTEEFPPQTNEGVASTSTPAVYIQYQLSLADSFKNTIRAAVDLFDERYDIPFDTLQIRDTLIRSDQRNGKYIPLAMGSPGEIIINRTSLSSLKRLKFVMEHELFHTIKPNREIHSSLQDPFILNDEEMSIQGFQGLGVVFSRRDKSGYLFSEIEEASAEFCALSIDSAYGSQSPFYFALANLLREMVDAKWITAETIAECQKKADLPKFCGLLLKKTATVDDILFVVSSFRNVLLDNSIEMRKKILYEIIEKRGDKGKYKFSYSIDKYSRPEPKKFRFLIFM